MSAVTWAKLAAVMPLRSPAAVPIPAMSRMGTSLMRVMETWSLPARRGAMVLMK